MLASMFTSLYLKLSKRRFLKTFKPLGPAKKRTFMVSVPLATHTMEATFNFLQGLARSGVINLLIPKDLEQLYRILPQRKFNFLTYTYPLRLFSKDYSSIKEQLNGKQCQYLIELNTPANIHLPYLSMIQKRMCFYDENAYPYYNILVKGGFASLLEFLSIPKSHRKKVKFSQKQQHEVLKKFNKKKPLLFVNGLDLPPWNGDTVIVGKEISVQDQDSYILLSACDAYTGAQDIFYDFARFLKKRILTE